MVQTVEDQTSDHVRYRVVVRGLLGDHLAGAFDQLEVDPRPGQTLLTGNFADQAQLHELLDQLRDLGIHLISVNPVPGAEALPMEQPMTCLRNAPSGGNLTRFRRTTARLDRQAKRMSMLLIRRFRVRAPDAQPVLTCSYTTGQDQSRVRLAMKKAVTSILCSRLCSGTTRKSRS
jgi:hypothetical protein